MGQRGTLLSVLTGFLFIVSLLGLLLITMAFLGGAHPVTRFSVETYFLITVTLIILELVSLVGVWSLKKWGAYLLALSYLLSLFFSFIAKGTLDFSFIFVLIIAYAIYRKWSLFK